MSRPALLAGGLFLLPLVFPAAARAEGGGLALPQSGVKAPYSPLAIPTRLAPLNDSLEALLNRRYHIVAAHPANGEDVLFLTRTETASGADSAVVCALTMPDPGTDQNVPTSRCWALNQPGRGK